MTVDGRRVGVVGAPLVQEPFGVLAVAVPGSGTYRVSDRPFAGSQRVGEFEGDGLVFALDGRSVRLRSSGPILDTAGPTPAHVRFDAAEPGAPRGLARVSLADASGQTLRRLAEPGLMAANRRGPAQTGRRAPDPRADADALRDALARADAERDALAAERDRLQAERDAALRAGTRSGRASGRNGALDAALARTAALDAEGARLRAERDQLVATRDRATAERARLAADLDAARRRGESADAAGQADRARLAEADAGRLRAEIVARDQTLAALGVESEDRRIRLAETDADLARTQRALLTVTAERDAARSERDVAQREPGRGRTSTADRVALLAERADLDAARARFEAERDAAAQNPSAVSPGDAALLAERQRSLDGLAAVSAERDALALQVAALQAERDRLYATVGRLASDLSAERLVVAQRRPDTARTAVLADRAERPASGTPVASFPGFDFSRLANPDLVRRRVDEAEYPDWAAQGGIEGDVLVLFQTDASGRVIRAAVATPIGGGLDALAENLVRDMVFVAPVVNGLATGLRSQVLVRFSRS